MKITKLGHCCLIIEENGLKILTDPGSFTTAQEEVRDIDVVLITHEHGDHIHVPSLKKVLANNPQAKVITNTGTSKFLTPENISFTLVEDGESIGIKGLKIEGHGHLHAQIYADWGQVQNTGYFIADKLFYPGDSFHNPRKPVEILALPVAGPWMKISEAIDYAKAVAPKTAFPVHDGMYSKTISASFQGMFRMIFEKIGIKFVPMSDGETKEF